jgi:zinc transport system ATP-binding protein
MDPVLKLQNVTTGYERQPVLEEVNLEVYPRDFIGIIGPNGGGKTTLLKVILNMIKPWKGEIIYNFGKDNQDFRKYVGYLPQLHESDRSFPISVKEVVLSGLTSGKGLFGRFSRADHEKAEQIATELGLDNKMSTPVSDLSGGLLQRTFLGRAIISDPVLLILDEPETHVDNRFEYELYEKLKTFNEKMAILLVSHDVGTVSSYIKTIACVNKNLHYHKSNQISSEQLKVYNCPIDIITHGQVPHRVLYEHKK